MSRSLSPDLRKALSERLRYYREMGIYDFYCRDAAPQPDSAETLALGDSIASPPELYPEHREQMSPRKSAAVMAPSEVSTLEVLTSKPEYGVADPVAALRIIREDLGDCTRCRLHKQGRRQIVFGVGNPNADLMFVGEAPGADEDVQGIPFVGRAGQLLTKIIHAIDPKRADVYIANVIKCRPPENRNPDQDEVERCEPFLFRQVDIIKPRV